MYLAGLADVNQTEWSACVNAGGVPYQHLSNPGEPVRFGCNFPPAGSRQAPAPANISVNVPTNTQVSPLISPQFIQQQQPTNSPIGVTGAKDTTGITDEYLAKASADESQRMQMILDALKNMQPSQTIVPATTQSADNSRATEASAIPAGIPILPLALLIAAGAGLVYMGTHRKTKRTTRRR